MERRALVWYWPQHSSTLPPTAPTDCWIVRRWWTYGVELQLASYPTPYAVVAIWGSQVALHDSYVRRPGVVRWSSNEDMSVWATEQDERA